MATPLWPIVLMGFASGLPNVLVTGQINAWCTFAGWNADELSALALVGLPYAWKVVWAPLVDRWTPPGGRRRGWMLCALTAAGLGLAALSVADPGSHQLFLALAIAIAAASATFDLASNGWLCDAVPAPRQGLAAGLVVWGWRLASVAVQLGFALLVAGVTWGPVEIPALGWGWSFAACAALLVPCIVAVACVPEPPQAAPSTWRQSLVEPFRHLHGRLGATALAGILALALLYKVSDGLTAQLVNQLLKERGIALGDLLTIRPLAGLLGAAAGAALGGWAVLRLGLLPALWIGLILLAGSNAGYIAIDRGWAPGVVGATIVLALDTCCATVGGATLAALFLRTCGGATSATQYALLTAVMAQAGVFGAFSGRLLAWSGSWTAFFAITIAACVPAAALLWWLRGSAAFTEPATAPAAPGAPAPGGRAPG